MEKPQATWKNTFHTNHRKGWDISSAITAARNAGYPFFTWNERVLPVPKKENFLNTVDEMICLEKDLPSEPSTPLGPTTRIILEYVPALHAATFAARLHASLPLQGEIREHLNTVHQELGAEAKRAQNKLNNR